MSDITIENILKQIEELPFNEQWRLHSLLGDKLSRPDKAPLDRRVPPKPMPEVGMRALRWVAEHAREYAGQWVAQLMMSVQIKAEYNQPFEMKPLKKLECALGTRQLQR